MVTTTGYIVAKLNLPDTNRYNISCVQMDEWIDKETDVAKLYGFLKRTRNSKKAKPSR